jgi:hypothetical protein
MAIIHRPKEQAFVKRSAVAKYMAKKPAFTAKQMQILECLQAFIRKHHQGAKLHWQQALL